jgi:membrane associated rhomboid family serine protease
MSTYDREYMRATNYPRNHGFLLWILGSMIVCYFAQIFCQLVLKNDLVTNALALSQDSLLNMRVWGLLSYAFAHESPLHIIFNLLIIFMVGRVVEPDFGSRKFVWACMATAFGGAVFFILFHLGAPGMQIIGASAIAMGLMTIFCLARPDEPVTFLIFFVLPISVRPRILIIIMAVIELIMLTAELQGLSGVASSAHLGGMLAGYFYYRKALAGLPLFPFLRRRAAPRKKTVQAPHFTINLTNRDAMRGEVDRILDKINSQGFGSLTEDERNLLDKAKDILNK